MFSPMQDTSELVPHIHHHHLLPGAAQGGDLTLDGLGHSRVDGSTQATVRGDSDDQVFGALLLWSFDVGLLVKS